MVVGGGTGSRQRPQGVEMSSYFEVWPDLRWCPPPALPIIPTTFWLFGYALMHVRLANKDWELRQFRWMWKLQQGNIIFILIEYDIEHGLLMVEPITEHCTHRWPVDWKLLFTSNLTRGKIRVIMARVRQKWNIIFHKTLIDWSNSSVLGGGRRMGVIVISSWLPFNFLLIL